MREWISIVEKIMNEVYEEDQDEDDIDNSDRSPAKNFLDEYYQHLYRHFFDKGVNVRVLHVGSDTVEIDQISVAIDNRRQGLATEAMKQIVLLADKHDVWLEIQPAANEDRPISTERLRLWYQSFGFEGEGKKMDRRPQRKMP